MKKLTAIILTLVLLLGLCGCVQGARRPAVMSDGTPWDNSWTGLGSQIGIEQPGGDFSLLVTNGSTKDAGLYYATWIAGKETILENDVCAYDTQLYLMAEPCTLATDAEDTLALWREQLGSDFLLTEERQLTAAGVTYTLLFYDCLAEDAHYACGVMALGVHNATAITVDLARVEDCDLDLETFIEEFLNGFHFA